MSLRCLQHAEEKYHQLQKSNFNVTHGKMEHSKPVSTRNKKEITVQEILNNLEF